MRCARQKSPTGIYHVMVRGINKQDIFTFDADRIKFLELLKICKEISGFELYAYCLMGNHVHLLIKEKDEPLEQIMKRLGSRYVGWYNWSHGRSGHLFQDRFKSEPVDTDEYFLTVLRYILRNPVQAGICKQPQQYQWSSFSDYTNGEGLTDVQFAVDMIGQGALMEFIQQDNEDRCLDDEKLSKGERDRQKFIQISGCRSVMEFNELNRRLQMDILKKCKEAGLSAKSIRENTGCSDYLLRKL